MTADIIGMPSISDWFKRLQKQMAHRANVRKTIQELNKLSNRELQDIGIGRSDIRSVAEGTWHD